MRVRKLDANNDMLFGQSLDNYWINVPDGPAQVVVSRLNMWLGDWWLDLGDGTPYNTKVLGKYTGNVRDAAIQARILGTDGVTSLGSYDSQVMISTREYTVQANINTAYGAITVVAGPI